MRDSFVPAGAEATEAEVGNSSLTSATDMPDILGDPPLIFHCRKGGITMAQKVVVQFVDDLDGTPLDGNGNTVEFAIDGVGYEIDLSEANARALRDALAPYVAAARRVGRPARRTRSGSASASANDAATIRSWAKENGFEVPARGRIPASVREAYANR